VGFKVSDKMPSAGNTVSVAFAVFPYCPEIVTGVELATALVVMVKVAEVLPAGTDTLAPTFATAVLPLDSVTIAPPAGAAEFSVTVPIEELPPATEEGVRAIDESVADDVVPYVA
jgi:hypothetical protein